MFDGGRDRRIRVGGWACMVAGIVLVAGTLTYSASSAGAGVPDLRHLPQASTSGNAVLDVTFAIEELKISQSLAASGLVTPTALAP